MKAGTKRKRSSAKREAGRMPESERRYGIPSWPEDSVKAAALAPSTGKRGGGGRPSTGFIYTLAGVAARARVKVASAWAYLGAAARSPFRAVRYIVRSRRRDLIAAGFTAAQVEGCAAVLAWLADEHEGEVSA